MTAPALHLPHVPSTISPNERRLLRAGVAGLHLLGLWGLLQAHGAPQLVRDQLPVVVHLLAIAPPAAQPKRPEPPVQPATPTSATPPTPSRLQPLQAQLPAEVHTQAAPPVVLDARTNAPSPTAVPSGVGLPEPAPQPLAAAPAPPAPAAPPAPPATPAPQAQPSTAPAPKPVPASALRYAVPPAIELPLASRRLRESGTVLLQVVFDTQGRVKLVSLLRSSGFARLDEQALAAMRQARIAPYLDEGQPVQVVAQAPLVYELE